MSIHTILSQEIEKMDSQLEELFNLAGFAILAYLKKEITEEERNALLDDWNTEAQKHYRSFATRIVEEAQREERERIFAHLVKADKAELLDSANISAFYNGCNAMLTILQKYIESRTKLQKMKGDL